MSKGIKSIPKNKKILVTGGTGSIGGKLTRGLLNQNQAVVRILSNDEDAIFQAQQELGDYENVRFLIGDVRDLERLKKAMEGIDIVYHAAALKHVPLCEYNPFEAIKTNVIGTQNVIEAALACGVEKVINISTDKAVNPINTMGATKLLGEKLIIDANFYKGRKKTIFSCVRFGNVALSRGSVIPLFEKQIESGGPVTVTDPKMTRFIMSVSEAVNLVLRATSFAKGGEIFIFKMPVVRLGDLVDVLTEELAPKYGYALAKIQQKVIGPRPGEKPYEELMTEIEAKNAFETRDMFIVLPQVEIPGLIMEKVAYPDAKKAQVKSYTSRDAPSLSKEAIRRLLREAFSS